MGKNISVLTTKRDQMGRGVIAGLATPSEGTRRVDTDDAARALASRRRASGLVVARSLRLLGGR